MDKWDLGCLTSPETIVSTSAQKTVPPHYYREPPSPQHPGSSCWTQQAHHVLSAGLQREMDCVYLMDAWCSLKVKVDGQCLP